MALEYVLGTLKFLVENSTPPLQQSFLIKAGMESNKLIFSSQDFLEKYFR
jgi:hypothetical protein